MFKNNEHKTIILKLFKILAAKDSYVNTENFVSDSLLLHFPEYKEFNRQDLEIELTKLIYNC